MQIIGISDLILIPYESLQRINANINDLNDASGGNARGYDGNYRAMAAGGGFNEDEAVLSNGTNYLCEYKIWEGAIDTTYAIRIKQMPDYRLFSNTDNDFINVSPPEKFFCSCRD